MTTAPVFWAPTAALQGPVVVLDGPEGRHAAVVRRLTVGERLDVVDGTGLRVSGVVSSVQPRQGVTLDVIAREVCPAPDPSFVLVQALPKGDRGERAVELATEAGVDVVLPWAASRCVTRWSGERGEKARARWLSSAEEAAKQSRRARWPQVAALATTPVVATRCRQAALAVVLHESATTALAGVRLPSDGEVVVVVGPEGGIDEQELAAFTAAGALPCRLGPEVLRTSSAGVVALALLSAARRWK